MPIDVYVAGDPGQVKALGEQLEGAFATSLDDQESTLIDVRHSVEDAWQGDAGEAMLADVNDLRGAAESMREAAKDIGDAIVTFGGRLESVQSLMDDARDVASDAGLVVTTRLVEDPPAPTHPEWETQGILTVPDDELEDFMAWRSKVLAYNEAAGIADNAVDDYASACQDLIDDLGGGLADLAGLAKDVLLGLVPGGIEHIGKDTLPHLVGRLEAAATRAGFFASISPEQSKLLYANLFSQVDALDDASLIRRLATTAENGGPLIDGLMVALNAIDRHEQGQSDNQILLAEGGGWLAGTLATAGTYAGIGAVFGAPATPVGSLVVGGISLLVGTGVGLFTSHQVDQWYEDEEFEDIIRNGLADQGRVPAG